MDSIEIALRAVGAFYAFAGYVIARAGLSSRLLDRAISAIDLKPVPRVEALRTLWLLTLSILVLASGVTLVFLLDLALWFFLAATLAQAAYLYWLAPRYFDKAEAPDLRGRRQTSSAFVLYSTATAFVAWAFLKGRLQTLQAAPTLALRLAATLIALHVLYVLWTYRRMRQP